MYDTTITERTVYEIAEYVFDDARDAKLMAAKLTLADKLDMSQYHCDMMFDDPRKAIEAISAYARDIDRINGMVSIAEESFVAPSLDFDYPTDAKLVDTWNEMLREVDSLWNDCKKISAIKLVRRCFGPVSPGLKQSKDWVEARAAA